VPSVDEGLTGAGERYREFATIAKENLGPDQPLFREHLTLMSFINRAASLHLAVVSCVRESNPQSAFTLLRAYLELVVTVFYVDKNPEYVAALESPMAELPRDTRKRFSDIFDVAAAEMVGVRAVYRDLNEMAHLGSHALWQPFTVEGDRRLSFSTYPRWRGVDEPRVALAMLMECDEAMAEVLARYAEHHVQPLLAREEERERIRKAFQSAGAEPSDEGVGMLPAGLRASAQSAGLLSWCAEHEAFEITEGITVEQVEAWATGLTLGDRNADSNDDNIQQGTW
jgi:hypothetical protein